MKNEIFPREQYGHLTESYFRSKMWPEKNRQDICEADPKVEPQLVFVKITK